MRFWFFCPLFKSTLNKYDSSGSELWVLTLKKKWKTNSPIPYWSPDATTYVENNVLFWKQHAVNALHPPDIKTWHCTGIWHLQFSPFSPLASPDQCAAGSWDVLFFAWSLRRWTESLDRPVTKHRAHRKNQLMDFMSNQINDNYVPWYSIKTMNQLFNWQE